MAIIDVQGRLRMILRYCSNAVLVQDASELVASGVPCWAEGERERRHALNSRTRFACVLERKEAGHEYHVRSRRATLPDAHFHNYGPPPQVTNT